MVIVNLRKGDETIDAQAIMDRFRWLEKVSQGTARKGKRIQILMATNHDGVLAAKIMAFLLQQLHIDYSLRPVKDNDDISKYITQVAQSCNPPPCIISLNCGANFRWEENFQDKGVHGNVRCLVIDSHRPVNLSNASKTSERVIILDDDLLKQTNAESLPSDSESETESEEFSQPELSSSQVGRKRPRNAPNSRAVKKSRIKEYYEGRGTFFANPAAMTAYTMCNIFKHKSADMLWCACVSLSAHRDLGMISALSFCSLADELEQCVKDLSADVGARQQDLAAHVDEDWHSPITYDREINAPLLRHWTLWDALYHSPYVYGRLGLHRQQGIRNLKEFLALSGIVPQEYSDHYRQMSWEVRQDLLQRFAQNRMQFRMNDIIIDQFSRQYPDVPKNAPETPASVNHLGASECAQILQALLDNDAEICIPETLLETTKPSPEKIRALLHKGIISNFNRAFDAALFRNYSLLSEGLHNAIQIQELIVDQARHLTDQKLNKRFGDEFHCVTLEHVVDPIMRRPLMARRLALWFIDTLPQEIRLPQLVIVKDPARRLYLCVGVVRTEDDTADYRAKNPFSKIFREIVRMTSCRCTPQARSFDEATLEVFDADFQTFVAALARSYDDR